MRMAGHTLACCTRELSKRKSSSPPPKTPPRRSPSFPRSKLQSQGTTKADWGMPSHLPRRGRDSASRVAGVRVPRPEPRPRPGPMPCTQKSTLSWPHSDPVFRPSMFGWTHWSRDLSHWERSMPPVFNSTTLGWPHRDLCWGECS